MDSDYNPFLRKWISSSVKFPQFSSMQFCDFDTNIPIKLDSCGKIGPWYSNSRFLCYQQLHLIMNKGIKLMMSSSMPLNPMGIFQEKLLNRMDYLWEMREQVQLILNQEAKKARSFKVRIKMFYLFA